MPTVAELVLAAPLLYLLGLMARIEWDGRRHDGRR